MCGPGAGIRGMYGSCHLVDHTPSPPLDRPSRQPVSDSVDRQGVSVADYTAVQEADMAVAEAVDDIAGTAEDVFGEVFGEISELCLVDVVCRITNIPNTM